MIYNFVCNKCKKEMTVEQPMSDPLPRNIECECGGVFNQNLVVKLNSMKFSVPCTFNDENYTPRDFGESDLEGYMN